MSMRAKSIKAVIAFTAVATLIFVSFAEEAFARGGRAGGMRGGGMRAGSMHAGRVGGYHGGVHRSAYRNTNVYVRRGVGVGVGAAAVGAAAAGAAYAYPRCGYEPYPPCY